MNRLTTFKIARLLDVSDQSVANWIDSGGLKADRTPGGHRRVERDDLVDFLTERNLRVPRELLPSAPTVLVVDDEKEVTQWLCQVIQESCPECRVLTANDGYTAGQVVLAERPDLVILDLYMPGMDGFEVCRKIKSDPRTRGSTVLAITAHPTPEAEKAVMDAGASAFLPKPVDAAQISALARELLVRRG
jgi:excisionase family DNA binding protein